MIKTILLAIAVVLLTCSMAVASPFVVTNTYPSSGVVPDNFVVTVDGGSAQTVTPQAVTGGVRLHFDIGGVSAGSHTVNIKACSTLWGCSGSFPFTFTKGVPSTPSDASIEP
jgi:hypothetical protein